MWGAFGLQQYMDDFPYLPHHLVSISHSGNGKQKRVSYRVSLHSSMCAYVGLGSLTLEILPDDCKVCTGAITVQLP